MVLMGMDLPIAAIRGQIAYGIDVLIHLRRMRDHSRKLVEIAEINGIKNGEIVLTPIYRFRETGERSDGIVGLWEQVGTFQKAGKAGWQAEA